MEYYIELRPRGRKRTVKTGPGEIPFQESHSPGLTGVHQDGRARPKTAQNNTNAFNREVDHVRHD